MATEKNCCNNMSRGRYNTHSFLEDLLVAKGLQISWFHSSNLRTDFNCAVQTVSIFYCEAVKLADERKKLQRL